VWYSYEGERLGQGVANAALYLEEHPEVAQRLEQAICEQVGLVRRANARAKADSRGADGKEQDARKRSGKRARA
jgi:recombination protein RecA